MIKKPLDIVYDTIGKYIFDMGRKEASSKICDELSQKFNVEIYDDTPGGSMHNVFMVKLSENHKIKLLDYITNYNIYQRSQKIKKINKL
ncbi:MAG: hypothetical protein ACOC3V_02690 [bacterium]